MAEYSVRESSQHDNFNPLTPEERQLHKAAVSESNEGSPIAARETLKKEVLGKDAHKSAAPGQSAVPGAVLSDDEVPFHPSPTIHEGRIQGLKLFEEHGQYLQTSLNFLSSARTALEAVDQAHAALMKDPSKTPQARTMLLSGPANKRFDAVYQSCIKTQETILAQIAHTESELSNPLVTGAMTDAHRELRQVIRSMPSKDERTNAISKAINDGDAAVITAALGAHPLTIGISQLDHERLTRMYNVKKSPEMVRRIEAMKQSLEVVASVAPILVKQFELAMRGSFAGAAKFRGLSEASEKALAAILGENKEG